MPPKAFLSPRVLILASRYDLTCDYVTLALHSRGVPFFRLNSEDLPLFDIHLDPTVPLLRGISPELEFEIHGQQLDAVYYRQPTFLRETSLVDRSAEEQFQRAQWAAFVRNLMVFDQCLWVNHPARTYLAEHKAIQLRTATQIGFDVLRTSISNSARELDWVANMTGWIAVKGLDTVLVRQGNTEIFGYTSLLQPAEITRHELRSAPMILQEGLQQKMDLRVTVVGDLVWCAAVTIAGETITGDWRLAKTDAEFADFNLPLAVIDRCVSLVRRLGLKFGAIDLALIQDRYYFLEINPTGEWAWLQAGLGFPIANAIAQLLSVGRSDSCADNL